MPALKEKYFGRMDNPDGYARVRGTCGDEMEFYLAVENNSIKDVKFFTEGCGPTRLCAETAAGIVAGKNIDEALSLSPADIKKEARGLPADHTHCTILSAITILKAIADYMYKTGL